MKSAKQLKEAEKVNTQQRELIGELQELSKDIERCETNAIRLKEDLLEINQKHGNRTTTIDDIHYLEDLLACAKRKLVWEKHMASLQKRTPELMEKVVALVNHPESSPDEQTRDSLMQSLHAVKESMARLNGAKL